VDAVRSDHLPKAMCRTVVFAARFCLSYLLVALALAVVTHHTANAAGEARPTEFQVKAAYLYNFGKFVRWPDSAAPSLDSPFTICVVGKNPFDDALEAAVAGQTINGHRVSLKNVTEVSKVAGCQILYVDGSETRRFKSVLNSVRRMPVVTVSDAGDFLDQGGMIQFVLVNDHVRFAVNLVAAREAGIQLSAELLKAATKVTGPGVAKEPR
jgi:hypothetical protein